MLYVEMCVKGFCSVLYGKKGKDVQKCVSFPITIVLLSPTSWFSISNFKAPQGLPSNICNDNLNSRSVEDSITSLEQHHDISCEI